MSMEPLMDGSWVSTSANYGTLLFFDRAGHETKSFTTSSFDGETRFVHEFFDNHEVYQIREGKWLGDVVFITDSYEYFDDGDYKLGQGLIVLDPTTDKVVYDYSFHGELGDQVAMDPLMPYSRPGIGDYAEDWLHANAVVHSIDDDGREYFLISLKAQDWIVKLYPDTDQLAWALGFEGAFTLVNDIDAAKPVALDPYDWAYHQHGMRFLDAEGPRLDLILFDNGYPRHDDAGPNWGLAYSRIVEMELDQDTNRAQIDFAYGAVHGPDSFFSSTCGNSILLPDGQRAVAMIGESDTMIEVSYPEGERRWSMSCESSDWCAYQVHWFPSLYDTHWIYE
jgi:Arylsulfotransferase (ASST)